MIANQPKLEQIDIFVRAIYIGTYSTTLMAEFYNNVFFYHFTGRIIGRNGEVIRSIQDRSRCKIKVERGQTFDGKLFILEFITMLKQFKNIFVSRNYSHFSR